MSRRDESRLWTGPVRELGGVVRERTALRAQRFVLAQQPVAFVPQRIARRDERGEWRNSLQRAFQRTTGRCAQRR